MPRRRSSKRSSSRRTTGTTSGSTLQREVNQLFKLGDKVDTALLLQLRQKYGDAEVASRVQDAFVRRHSMIVRGAKNLPLLFALDTKTAISHTTNF